MNVSQLAVWYANHPVRTGSITSERSPRKDATGLRDTTIDRYRDIMKNNGTMTTAEISSRLGLMSGGALRLLKVLAERGYVIRCSSVKTKGISMIHTWKWNDDARSNPDGSSCVSGRDNCDLIFFREVK